MLERRGKAMGKRKQARLDVHNLTTRSNRGPYTRCKQIRQTKGHHESVNAGVL